MNLVKSTAVVSFFTLLSRISGLIRDVLVARFLGFNLMTDAFYVAFRIPNLLRRLFAEGSFSLAFIPVLSEVKARNNQQLLRDFLNHVFGCLLLILLVVLALMEIIAPGLVSVFGAGFIDQPDVFNTTVGMLRVTLPYIVCISLVAFSAGILNSFGRFALPAATPILLNLSLIWAVLFLRDSFDVPIKALAYGVLVAGVLQLLIQIPALIRLGLLPKPVVKFHDPEVKKVMTLMLPTLLGSSVAQINLLVDTSIATMLPLVGSPSFLFMSDRLLEFPLGLFGIAISTVILPKLSSAFADLDDADYQHTLKWAMSLAMFIALPSALGLLLLAKPVVMTLFIYGESTVQDAQYISYSLMVFMLGLPAFVANKVLLPAFYSRKDTKSPVKIALKAMLINVLLNFVFVGVLYYFNVVSLHVGLAMASVGSAWLQCLWLYRKLRSDDVIQRPLLSGAFLLKIISSLFLMAAVVLGLLNWMPEWHEMRWYQRSLNLFMIIGSAVFVYFFSMWVLKGYNDIKSHNLKA